MKNKKKAVKLAPKDYVNTLIWFLGGFWVEIMLDGNFTYNLGADTCISYRLLMISLVIVGCTLSRGRVKLSTNSKSSKH